MSVCIVSMLFESLVPCYIRTTGLRYLQVGGMRTLLESRKKLEVRKMLAVGAARREAAVPSVQRTLCY